ncbi:MAG: SMR family transporter, partial [Spirochaetaceae bacterium]|nr:SMR family transporter [Spirochaetaceae bacterium]
MDIAVFSLVIASSFVHAFWNFISKKVSGNLQITLAGLWIALLTLMPFSLIIISKQGLDPVGLKFVFITSVAHVAYYLLLYLSYKHGDISSVYPISRGTGIAGTAVAAFFLLGERFSVIGTVGIIFIFLGVLSISIKKKLLKADLLPIIYALGLGATIIIYSINDKQGVSYINSIVYLNLKDLIAVSVMTPFVFRKGLPQIKEIIKKNWKYCAIIGYGAVGAYLMILFAFTMGKVGYISALREFSIVIASVLGFLFL